MSNLTRVIAKLGEIHAAIASVSYQHSTDIGAINPILAKGLLVPKKAKGLAGRPAVWATKTINGKIGKIDADNMWDKEAFVIFKTNQAPHKSEQGVEFLTSIPPKNILSVVVKENKQLKYYTPSEWKNKK